MKYKYAEVQKVADELLKKAADEPSAKLLRSQKLRALYGRIQSLPAAERADFGRQINHLKKDLQELIDETSSHEQYETHPLDITAPFDENIDNLPINQATLPLDQASLHPIAEELDRIRDIFLRMGFTVEDSRQLDDDFNMFGALNFPPDHPARDDYDTFMTDEGLIPPAHTSTMQHRVLRSRRPPIRAVIPGRTYRNEDVDATHEHTFHQVEGVYVDEGVALSDMIGTIQTFLETYFDEKITYKTQPFYFPFVEPGLEFLIKTPGSLRRAGLKDDWMEIMGCGMIHPNVLRLAGLDSKKYSGFAWGGGVERLIILKYGIEDIRLFHSANLQFLRSLR